jgi:hypothetical protein
LQFIPIDEKVALLKLPKVAVKYVRFAAGDLSGKANVFRTPHTEVVLGVKVINP